MVAKLKNQTMPLFIQTMCWCMLLWFLLLSITLGLTLRYSLESLQDKVDDTLEAMVTTIAISPAVREALEVGYGKPELTDYLDDLVVAMEDLDVITIADENAVRIYHVNKDLIGKSFVGGDEGRVLTGESYFSNATGTMGYQRRFFSPVQDEEGAVIGFVMAGTTQGRMSQLRNQIAVTYGKLLLLLTVCTLIFSALLAAYLNRILRGARPEDLVKTYLTQNDVLNSLDDGLISLDPAGRIRLVNRTAVQTLGKSEESLLGLNINALLTDHTGGSLLGLQGENLATNRPNILVNSLLFTGANHWARQVLILKDRTELRRQAELLGGTRHMISALRANNHEFINKVQVIAGYLQMGRSQDALEYIGNVSAEHAQIIFPIMQRIHNANVAALLLGKLNNMRERDISMTLLGNSELPEHSRFLSTQELVTVVGNLLENAIEAVDPQPMDRDRNVVLQITEDHNGLLIMVSDSGVGIDQEELPQIFLDGYSTKANQGRGVGMGLITSVVDRHGGDLEVESEPGAGTTFTLIFDHLRGGTV